MLKIHFYKIQILVIIGLFINVVIGNVILTNEPENLLGEDCNSLECMNGGDCEMKTKDGYSFAYCICKSGFTGMRCEMQYIQSGKNTFLLNMMMANVVVDDGGSSSETCSSESNELPTITPITTTTTPTTTITTSTKQTFNCGPNPCLNDGVCTSNGCICQSGFSGPNCESFNSSEICDNINCTNGRCIKLPDRKYCLCRAGFRGEFCEMESGGRTCSCTKNGECEIESIGQNTYAYCKCRPGFTDQICNTEYFKCEKNGRFIDSLGCIYGYYFECVNVGIDTIKNPNGIVYRRKCPLGLRYNQTSDHCDYANKVPCEAPQNI